MSLETHLTCQWAGRLCTFRLGLAQLEALDDKAAVGPLTMLRRLTDGGWRVGDVRETVRLGLVGGGLSAEAAVKLVRDHVDTVPLEASVPLAAQILAAALRGRPRRDAGNVSRAEPEPATGSTSPSSGSAP